MVISVSLFSSVSLIVEALAPRYPITQPMFFRCAIALMPAAILVPRHPSGLRVLRTGNPVPHNPSRSRDRDREPPLHLLLRGDSRPGQAAIRALTCAADDAASASRS